MKEEFENCVLCGKETDVLKNTPIELRENYIECGGQLCAECMEELNATKGSGD